MVGVGHLICVSNILNLHACVCVCVYKHCVCLLHTISRISECMHM